MHIRANRNRLPRCDRRSRYAKDGPKEDTRSCRLVTTKDRYRSKAIPGVHRVLPIFYTQLLKNCTSSSRPNQEDHTLALGQTSTMSLRNPKDLDVSKTCPSPT